MGKRLRAILTRNTALALCLFTLAILDSPAVADSIILPVSGTVTDLKERALVRPDPAGQLQPSTLLSTNSGFQTYKPALEKKSEPVWLKLQVEVPPTSQGDYVLMVKRRFFQRFRVYLPGEGGQIEGHSAGLESFEPTESAGTYYVYDFTVTPGSSLTLLLHVKTIQQSLRPLELSISDALTYQKKQSQDLWAYGLYFGAVLALVFYNFILYLNLKSPGHRMYVASMILVLLFMGLDSGVLQKVFPTTLVRLVPTLSIIANCLAMAAMLRFFQIFANSSYYIPKLHNVVTAFVTIFVTFTLITVFVPQPLAAHLALALQIIVTLALALLLFTSLLAGLRGSSGGYIFLAAWFAFVMGTFSRSLLTFDLIERIPAAEYSLYIGSVMEAMILALGLSYRVGQLRTQRNRALREQHKAARLANIDPLTGAYNRRFIENYLDGLLHSEDKRAFQGSLIMLDMDKFKPINDEYGHAAGDAVLTAMASRCIQTLRSEDVLARMGGDEFAIVLPDQSGADARAVAERLCNIISGKPASFGMQPIQMSVSIGVVTDFAPGATAYSAFRHADHALYQAKRAGRNRVVVSTGGEEPAPKEIPGT